MRQNLRIKFYFNLVTIILVWLIFINQTYTEEKIEESQIKAQETSEGTRIVISTSGPAQFSSYGLDEPHRLVIEFQSRNVLSRVDSEIIVNQGVIKRITSSYFKDRQKGSLKSLSFELSEKVPYKIWQEGNTILLEIQAPLGTTGFSIGAEGKEALVEPQTADLIKRLEAMDSALEQVSENQEPSENPDPEATIGTIENLDKGNVIPVESLNSMQNMIILLWLVQLLSLSGLGFLIWRNLNLNSLLKKGRITGEEKALLEKDQKLGIKPKIGMKKEDLIRSIQIAEGNFPCFGTAKDYCDQLGCCFRDDCLPR